MPAVITHSICGFQAYKKLKKISTFASQKIQENKNLYTLGTQGPDIFFHCIYNPSLPKFGVKMHTDCNIQNFFKYALQYSSKLEGKDRDAAYAYLAGFLCHYSLDSQAHPFVFYHTGFDKERKNENNDSGVYHRMMESELDCITAKIFCNQTAYEFNAPRKLKLSFRERKIVTRLYEYAIPRAYGEKLKVFPCTFMLPLNYKLFRDKNGTTKKFIYKLESIINVSHSISALIHPTKCSVEKDFLNEKNQPWYNPWDEKNPRYDSFLDLFDKSAVESAVFSRELYSVLYENKNAPEALELFGSRSFESGQSADVEFIISKCIYTDSHAMLK